MKCELAHETIALAAYGEVTDEQAHLLELHLEGCEDCRRELEATRLLHQALSMFPVEEPSANLIARARLRLEEVLDTLPQGGLLLRFSQKFMQGMGRLRSAPVMASALLVAGIAVGGYAGYRTGVDRATQANAASAAATRVAAVKPATIAPVSDETGMTPQIARVSSIVQQPNSGNLEVRYDRLVPETMQGSIDDPAIRQLLILATQERANANVHDDSVGLLANECRAGRHCSDGRVRSALMVALRYDSNASVRLKALEGLQPYIPEDMRVRDAVLEALMNDKDARVRSEAINLLEPVEGDSSVREVLHTVSMQDVNPHIRTVSREVLEQEPEIQ